MSEVFYNAKNLTVSNGFIRNPDRYYLEEYFNKLPKINSFLVGSATFDASNLVDSANETPPTTVNVLGASLGDFAIASFGADTLGLTITANVTAANQVKVSIINETGGAIDLASTTLSCKVFSLSTINSPANDNFEILGTNASSEDVIFSSTDAGIILETNSTNNDQIIIAPHLDTFTTSQNQSAWSGIKWSTDKKVEWCCAIKTDTDITNVCIWAGLKTTNDPAYATDNVQAYFLFSTNNTKGILETYTNLHFVHCDSTASNKYITDLGITIEASKIYKLRIVFDSNRQISVFVNGIQYGLTNTTTSKIQSNSKTISNILPPSIPLIPYVGIETLPTLSGSTAKKMTLCYEKISRDL